MEKEYAFWVQPTLFLKDAGFDHKNIGYGLCHFIELQFEAHRFRRVRYFTRFSLKVELDTIPFHID
jgi:hypothetical protein